MTFFHKTVLWKKPYPIKGIDFFSQNCFVKTEHFFAKCAINSKTEGISKKVVKSKSVLNWNLHSINNFPEVVLGPQAPYWAFFAKCAYCSKTEQISKKVIMSKTPPFLSYSHIWKKMLSMGPGTTSGKNLKSNFKHFWTL